MKRIAPLLAVALLAGCGGKDEAAPEGSEASDASQANGTGEPAALGAGKANLPPRAADFPALASKDCAEVVEFYLEAISGHDWVQAALVWNDPVIDAERLQAVYGSYKDFRLEWNEPFVEGAAGSAYCTVSGKLTDAADPAKALREGTLLLKRVNDVPGATADQLRWTLRSSTFVENLERSERGEP
jgi:hypothetical protein